MLCSSFAAFTLTSGLIEGLSTFCSCASVPLPSGLVMAQTGRLFVRNLAYGVSEDDLRRLFEPFGMSAWLVGIVEKPGVLFGGLVPPSCLCLVHPCLLIAAHGPCQERFPQS